MAEDEATFKGSVPANDQNPNPNDDDNNNNKNAAESLVVTSDDEREKTLEFADELFARGMKAELECDYAEAADCFSRALEIRVAQFGELAPECVTAYYKYGCALLYKVQEKTELQVSMRKKEDVSLEYSNLESSVKEVVDGEFSTTNSAEQDEEGKQGDNESDADTEDQPDGDEDEPADTEDQPDADEDEPADTEDQPDDDEEDQPDADEDEPADTEDQPDGDEEDQPDDDEDESAGTEYQPDDVKDESELDLAWKMLDVARAIAEKSSGDTMEKVDIFSTLGEVALEREDVETSLSEYLKALSILERLAEADSRLNAELNHRICLCLEICSRPEEAIPYCQKALSISKCSLQLLSDEAKNIPGSAKASTISEMGPTQSSSATSLSVVSVASRESEINRLTSTCIVLEKKIEDLQQLVANPNSTFTATTTADSGVAHLGVVGRGVKRVVMGSTTESIPAKKPAVDSSNNGDDSAS